MAQQTSGITAPHEHDVLSGRGNFVNYHAGNEHFRALVRKYKLEYVKCPKPQKGKFSRLIVDEIKNRNPPGRFLKQDNQTKLWYDIGEKKALDKTRQALREGAPEIMKEMTGESGDDTDGEDNGRVVQKEALNGSMGGFSADNPLSQFVANAGMSSPVLNRNSLLMSPQLGSPGMLSPNMLMGQLSPEFSQFSGGTSGGRMGRMVDPSNLPGPPLQSIDTMNQINVQQQAAMLLNTQMGNNFSNGMGGAGMLSPQQIQLQNQINAQQEAMNQISQQLQQQQLLLNNNQSNFAQMQMLQNKMQNITRQNVVSSNLNPTGMFNADSTEFNPRPIDQIPPPPPAQAEVDRQQITPSQGFEQSVPQAPEQVESLSGDNPRRMPPPSLLKREDSLKMDKLFTKDSPASSAKRKVGNNASVNHLSAMSLSIGDMNEDGNLSAVFDQSLRISNHNPTSGVQPSKEKLKDRSSQKSWEISSLDMSQNTLGMNMSYATFGDPKMHESDGNMSFSKLFDDQDKDG